MRPTVLAASIIAAILANLLIFGALSRLDSSVTPLQPRVLARPTFTPDAASARRLVTPTATPAVTAVPTPTLDLSNSSDQQINIPASTESETK